jgi:hypothetical protein
LKLQSIWDKGNRLRGWFLFYFKKPTAWQAAETEVEMEERQWLRQVIDAAD